MLEVHEILDRIDALSSSDMTGALELARELLHSAQGPVVATLLRILIDTVPDAHVHVVAYYDEHSAMWDGDVKPDLEEPLAQVWRQAFEKFVRPDRADCELGELADALEEAYGTWRLDLGIEWAVYGAVEQEIQVFRNGVVVGDDPAVLIGGEHWTDWYVTRNHDDHDLELRGEEERALAWTLSGSRSIVDFLQEKLKTPREVADAGWLDRPWADACNAD